jgi:hypothetical protein
MKIEYGKWDWHWHLRLLPSIEFTSHKACGLGEHYGYNYEVCLRWLPYWFCISFGRA